MKANEFVRKYGIAEAKAFLSLDSEVEIVYTASFFDDLKRLVESHEMVESYGGLEDAKKELQRQSILRWINPETEALRQAIADVESCQ